MGCMKKPENSTGLKNLHADYKNSDGLDWPLNLQAIYLSQENNFPTRTCKTLHREK